MKKEYEFGRSMIEMLGVLAIIGVLSVGGIAGYTTAMRSHRANEIIHGASMLYMMGMSQNGGEGNGILQFTTSIGDVPSGANEITYNGGGTITIDFTDLSVCQQAKNKLGDKAGNCTAAAAPANGYNLTVTLGDTAADPDEDPATGGYYVCIEGTSLLTYYNYSETNGYVADSSKNITCSYLCDIAVAATPTYFSTAAVAKASACMEAPISKAECLAANKYWVDGCYDTKSEAEHDCGTIVWNDHEGECM